MRQRSNTRQPSRIDGELRCNPGSETKAHPTSAAVDDAEGERAKIQAMTTELEDCKNRLANRLLEIEELSDKLQGAATDIVKLETRNAEMEDSLANRSTETEAQHRQEEVFQLKEDIEGLKRDYGEAQLDLATKSQEIATGADRIQQLESELAGRNNAASADVTHAHLLHAKIETLRTERNELRQTISFAKHEQRFALSAAEADKASAILELQLVKAELVRRDAEIDKLQGEISGHREQLDGLTAELEGVRGRMAEINIKEQDAFQQQIQRLQAELADSKSRSEALQDEMRETSNGFMAQYQELQQQVNAAELQHQQVDAANIAKYAELGEQYQALQSEYAKAQIKLADAEKQRQVALAERDEGREKLDSLQAAGTAVSSVVEGPSTEARVRKHSRRASLQIFQDHMALEQSRKADLEQTRKIESLQLQLQAEKERVKRRDGTSHLSMCDQLIYQAQGRMINARISSSR